MSLHAYISAKLQKCTYTYTFQSSFQVKRTPQAVKHEVLFLFTEIMIMGRLLIDKHLFLCSSLQNTMLCPQNTFTIVHNLYTKMFASHNLHHMYGFSDIVNMLGNAPGTVLYLRYAALESHETLDTTLDKKKLKVL